jgi:hypothetical protein
MNAFSVPVRIGLSLVWAALLAEALLLSPAARPDQTAWLVRLLTGDWSGEEPLVVALFQLMGIWPFAMGALLAPRLRRRPIPLWPFAVASMALGAFALLPGIALGGTPVDRAERARWQVWLGSRVLVGLLALPAAALVLWGVFAGSPAAFLDIWRTEQFVHVMALDFLVLWLASVVFAWAEDPDGPWWVAGVPLFGALAFRALRPLSRPPPATRSDPLP